MLGRHKNARMAYCKEGAAFVEEETKRKLVLQFCNKKIDGDMFIKYNKKVIL
jgi:hypothetical protein